MCLQPQKMNEWERNEISKRHGPLTQHFFFCLATKIRSGEGEEVESGRRHALNGLTNSSELKSCSLRRMTIPGAVYSGM